MGCARIDMEAFRFRLKIKGTAAFKTPADIFVDLIRRQSEVSVDLVHQWR